MSENSPEPAADAAQVQEAVDTLVRAFEYPESLSVEYRITDGTKRTTVTVNDSEGSMTYELRFDAHDDDGEPAFVPVG